MKKKVRTKRLGISIKYGYQTFHYKEESKYAYETAGVYYSKSTHTYTAVAFGPGLWPKVYKSLVPDRKTAEALLTEWANSVELGFFDDNIGEMFEYTCFNDYFPECLKRAIERAIEIPADVEEHEPEAVEVEQEEDLI